MTNLTSSSSSSSSMALLPSPAANDGITALSYFFVNRCCSTTTAAAAGGEGVRNNDNGNNEQEDSNDNTASATSTSNSTTLLASTSWDGCIRIHDTTDPFHAKLVTQHNMEAGPLLALDTYSSSTTGTYSTGSTTNSGEEDLFDAVFTGGLDGSIRRFHVPTSRMEVVGSHYHQHNRDKRESISQEEDVVLDCACSCIRILNDKVVASAGWDSCFYLWNVKNPTAASASTKDATSGNDHHDDNVTRQPLARIRLPGKAFSMDSISPSPNFHRIAIATANRRLVIIDVELVDGDRVSCAKVVLDRESSLKYQSRVCRFFPDGSGIAIGSIEGRVAIEFLTELNVEPPQNNMKKYAFKCHRQNDIVYPVNDIAFHPTYGTFATGGCDGTVVTWDGLHKKKLTVLPTFPTSIAALAFSRDGKQLAIASSYTFERGGEGDCNEYPNKKDDEIYIKILNDKDIMPKTLSGNK